MFVCASFHRWGIFLLKDRRGRRAVPIDLMQSPSITLASRLVAVCNKFKVIIQRWHMGTLNPPDAPRPQSSPSDRWCAMLLWDFWLSLPCSALLSANETMLKYLVDWIHSWCRRGVPNCSYYTNIKMESAGCAEAICVFPRSEIFFESAGD